MNRHPSMKKSFTQNLGRLILPTILSLGFFSATVSQAQVTTNGFTNVYWVSTNLWVSGNAALGGTASWNGSSNCWTTNSLGATGNSNGPIGGGTFVMANGPANTTTNNNSGGFIVNFSGTPGTVSQSSVMQVNQVNFLVNGYTWTASGARSLTFTNGIYLTNGVNTIITASAGNSFTFTGTGVSGGTGSSLTLGAGNTSGNSNYVSAIYFSGGTISVPITMNVGGASNAYAAKFTLGTQSSTGGGLTINGNITNNSAGPLDLTNSASGDLVINGVISGSRGITLGNSSSGNIVLNSANTYSGGTVLLSTSSGEIRYSNSTTFGSGAITSSGNGTTNYIRALANNLDLANAITIDANNTLRVGATNTDWKANYSGDISGSGSVLYSYSGNLGLSGTNSSFGGGFVLGSSGRADLSKIGMAGQNSSIGTNGVIAAGTITTPSSKPTIRWVGTTNDTSDKVINIGNSSGGLQLETIGNGDLTLNGNINSSGAGGPKTIFIYPYTNSSAGTTNTLSLNGVINDGTPGSVVNDAAISSGAVVTTNVVNGVTNKTTNYYGSSTITLASVAGVISGASISGGGCIAPGTTIASIASNVITLSQNTTNTNSIAAGLAVMDVAGATAATSLTIQPKSSAGSTYVNVVLGNTANSFSGGVLFTNAQSGLVSLLKISKFGNPGENSSLGTAGNVTFGGASGSTCTLDYTGSGEVSSKTLTLGGSLGTVGLSQSGSGLLKLTGSVLPGTTTAGRTLLLTGSSSGLGELGGNLGDPNGFALTVSKSGSGTWTLSGTNNYSGATIVAGSGTDGTNSVLKVAGTNALSTLTSLSGSASSSGTATLDLSVAGNYVINSYGTTALEGKSMNFMASSGGTTTLTFTNATNVITASTSSGRTLNNNSTNLILDFLGALDISSSTANDITLGGVGDFKVRGVIFNSSNATARSLTKSGSGTLRLYATNTYNGTTTVRDGKLVMADAKALPASSPTVLDGGQLKVDYSDANSATLGNLRLTADSTIDAGTSSASTLNFASASNWLSTNNTLKISSYYPVGAKIFIVNTNGVPLAQIKKQEDTNMVASLASDGLLSFSVPKTNQTITFGALSAKTYGDAGFSLSASASSGLTVSYASSDSSVATVAGNTVTIVGAGTTTITASQAGNDSYNPASSVAQTLTVNKANQTITFGALAAVKVGDPSVTLSATASSGLTVSYVSLDSTVASVLGNAVTILKAGTTTITASQSGNRNYNAATSVNQTLTVTSAGPTFDSAYQGKNMSDIAPNGLSYLMNYALGGSDTTDPKLPVQDTTDPTKLALVAYVRTGDTSLSVSGEAAATLDFSSPSNAPYVVITNSDAPAGMEKRSYSVSVGGDRKFLRLKATKQ